VSRFVGMMRKAAELGSAKAQFSMGLLYLNGPPGGGTGSGGYYYGNNGAGDASGGGGGGRGSGGGRAGGSGGLLKRSVPDALRSFKLAAGQGHKEALCNLGR
jgi:TPR repeat protein